MNFYFNKPHLTNNLVRNKPHLSDGFFRLAFIALCLLIFIAGSLSKATAQELNQLRQITPNFESRVSVRRARVTADGAHLVFIANLNNRRELFSMAIGSDNRKMTRLSVDLIDQGDVSTFRLSPDGQTVVYLADSEVDRQEQLFSVPVIGGDNVLLTPDLNALPGRTAVSPQIDPSGTFVLYSLDLTTEDEFQLFRVPIAGGPSQVLSRAGVSGRSVRISKDGANVVFASDERVNDVFELFTVPLLGSATDARRLHPPLNSDQRVSDSQISPDGMRIIYQVSTRVSRFIFIEELFHTPADASNNDVFLSLVDDYPSATGDIGSFDISPDGRFVVYASDQRDDSRFELFRVPISGGLATNLSGSLASSGRVRGFAISPDNNQIVYQAVGFNGSGDSLLTVPLNGNSDQVQALEAPLDVVNSIENFVISGDGRNVIYEKRFDIDDTIQLFIAPATGGQSPSALTQVFGDPDENEEGILSVSINDQHLSYIPPDGRRIFVARIALPANDNELCLPIKTQNNKLAVICL